MLRTGIAVVVVLVLVAGGLLAAEGTVVSFDKDTNKLVVKVADKERTIELKPNTHIHDTDGSELRVQDRAAKLKKDTKVELVEKGGKLIEISIKK